MTVWTHETDSGNNKVLLLRAGQRVGVIDSPHVADMIAAALNALCEAIPPPAAPAAEKPPPPKKSARVPVDLPKKSKR